MNKSNEPYDRSVRSLNNSENYEFSGESEYSRERSDPYQMVDYLIDHGLDYKQKDTGAALTFTDEALLEDVRALLARDKAIDAGQIEAEVRRGVVYLRGHVDSRQTKRLVELSIENLSGVNDVINQISF